MGLYQRPDSDVYWISYTGSDGRRVRESTQTSDKEAAKRLLKDREGRAARGEVLLPRVDRITYDEARVDLVKFYKTYQTRDLVEAEARLKHLDAFFSKRRLATITPDVVTSYADERRAEKTNEEGETVPGAANGTINRELETLSKMLRLAYKNGKLSRLPFVEKLAEAPPRAGFVTREQSSGRHQRACSHRDSCTGATQRSGRAVNLTLMPGKDPTMIAAVYARKSTEQHGVGDEEKSVTRQIEHAKAYATRKGCLVDDAYVYVDDGISGAEFIKRPGFIRLMNTLSPRPPFQILVMSEESRLGREQIETAYALKQITDAGVRVFFYLEDRERTLNSAIDKVMLSLTNFASEMEREKARQRTYDAMLRKAKALHVTGGKVYGYDNIEILGPDGARARVARRINEEQAAVLRRIFELYAGGTGMLTIAHRLNAEGVKPPRGRGWAPSGIREMLHRPLYRGEVVWNRSQKIMRAGTKKQRRRDESEWLRFEAPELRIVSEELWQRVKARLDERAGLFPRCKTTRQLIGRPRYQDESAYLLVGFVRCSVCGGPGGTESRA